MSFLDKESIALQNKLREQDETLEKLKSQEDKLNKHINDFREAIDKKLLLKKQQDKKISLDTTKLTTQLNQEIKNAQKMLKTYENQLKKTQKKTVNLTTNDLEELDDNLRNKQQQLKSLKEEIKNLTFVKRKQEKLIEKKEKEEDGQKLTKLVEEVRKNKELLEKMRIKHQEKKQFIEKKKNTIKQLEGKYWEKCQKSGDQPITFQDFLEKKKQRRKDGIEIKEKNIKKYQSVRDIINSQAIDKVQYNQKTFKQLKIKKQVAENSLRNAEKKYSKEIDDLRKKLERLKIQNQDLTERLVEKRKEKEILESKVNSSNTNRK